MPEEDTEDGADVGGADGSTVAPGRQLGRRGNSRGAAPHHSSRVYHAPAASQRRPDDSSSRLLLQTDKSSIGVQRPLVQHGVTADDPPPAGDDQHSLLPNGFVRDRDRIYHDNSVIV